MTRVHEAIAGISKWVDGHNADKSPGHLRRIRIGKITEELGEVEERLIEVEQSNPRKTTDHPAAIREAERELIHELLDVALTALGAVEHLTGNAGHSLDHLAKHIVRTWTGRRRMTPVRRRPR